MNTIKLLVLGVSLLSLSASDSSRESILRGEEKSSPTAAALSPEKLELLHRVTFQGKLTKVIGFVGTIAHPLPGDRLELKFRDLPEKMIYLPRPSKDGQDENKNRAWIPLLQPLVIEGIEIPPKNHGGAKVRLGSRDKGTKLVIAIWAPELVQGTKVRAIIYYENDDIPYGMAEAEGVLE